MGIISAILGVFAGYVRHLRDRLQTELNERIKLQAALIQSEKMVALGSMAAGMAHELNNPLGVIKGYALLLEEKSQLDPAGRQRLAKLLKGVDRMERVLRQLNILGRSETKESTKPFDLNELIRETVAFTDEKLKTTGIQPRLELDADAPIVLGYPMIMESVFHNLIANSHDAFQTGDAADTREIRITTSIVVDEVHVIYEDTAGGMTEDVHEKAFDPFFTTKEVGLGTGLGLSIVRAAVDQHGGRVLLANEPGSGVRFDMRFPIAPQR